ncbi:MAG: glycosyltransferase family 1 protein [Firmicutes bacterium HGW-Firmicutes-8]|nr:MAG: glycosyltransferase family 1 protein [Firmicutes bacterium HGW-Firmicutes-8]
MNIAQIHWAFPPVIGGVESHLAMLGPELIKNNCRVSLLTGAVEGLEEEDRYEEMYIKRTPLMDLNSLDPQNIAAQAGKIRKQIEQFIDKTKPDIIHAHNMHYFSPLHADILYEIKQDKGIPLVLTAHNVWAEADKTWQEMNSRAHYWDAVIAVSDYIKQQLGQVGYDKKTITVVHHGIDLNRFSPVSACEKKEIAALYSNFRGRQVIFHPARMSLDKGCHISVKALKIIKEEFPNVLLVLAGTGQTVDWGAHQQKHVAKIMGLIDELGLRPNVYARLFDWHEMPILYKVSDLCVYPSCFEEPFGLVMLESMATEKPIVVSKAGGMPEVIQNGVNGFVVKMGSAAELAERCGQLLRSPRLCCRMGKQGRSMVEKYWTKDIMTAATLAVYQNTKTGAGKKDAGRQLLA